MSRSGGILVVPPSGSYNPTIFCIYINRSKTLALLKIISILDFTFVVDVVECILLVGEFTFVVYVV